MGMTGLEIALFILGTVFIIISFFIVDNSSKKSGSGAESADIDREALEKISEELETSLNQKADFILRETEEKLEKLSDDKILAVDEFSEQVLDKIKTNHNEVVFLYQMLTDKEEEIKETSARIENLRIECEKLIGEQEKLAAEQEKLAAEQEKKAAELAASRAAAKASASASSGKTGTAAKASGTTRSAKTASASKTSQSVKRAKPAEQQITAQAPENLDTGMLSRNDEIIALYKSRKSVMEISKLLGMGQGEVKLIIDLYCK